MWRVVVITILLVSGSEQLPDLNTTDGIFLILKPFCTYLLNLPPVDVVKLKDCVIKANTDAGIGIVGVVGCIEKNGGKGIIAEAQGMCQIGALDPGTLDCIKTPAATQYLTDITRNPLGLTQQLRCLQIGTDGSGTDGSGSDGSGADGSGADGSGAGGSGSLNIVKTLLSLVKNLAGNLGSLLSG